MSSITTLCILILALAYDIEKGVDQSFYLPPLTYILTYQMQSRSSTGVINILQRLLSEADAHIFAFVLSQTCFSLFITRIIFIQKQFFQTYLTLLLWSIFNALNMQKRLVPSYECLTYSMCSVYTSCVYTSCVYTSCEYTSCVYTSCVYRTKR